MLPPGMMPPDPSQGGPPPMGPGGPPPGPGGPGGQIDPSILMALMGGGGGPGGPGGPIGPGDAVGQGQNPSDLLTQVLDLLTQYGQAEPDPEDQAIAAQCFAQLKKLQAKDQKEEDAAMGTTPAHKFLRNQNAQQTAA